MTTVLICDDHRMVREGLRQSVQALPGVDRVDTAESGEEVLARWPSERPDLVLMDVSMPGLGGLETTRRLVREHPEARVVMLTGAGDRAAAARAVAGGARGGRSRWRSPGARGASCTRTSRTKSCAPRSRRRWPRRRCNASPPPRTP